VNTPTNNLPTPSEHYVGASEADTTDVSKDCLEDCEFFLNLADAIEAGRDCPDGESGAHASVRSSHVNWTHDDMAALNQRALKQLSPVLYSCVRLAVRVVLNNDDHKTSGDDEIRLSNTLHLDGGHDRYGVDPRTGAWVRGGVGWGGDLLSLAVQVLDLDDLAEAADYLTHFLDELEAKPQGQSVRILLVRPVSETRPFPRPIQGDASAVDWIAGEIDDWRASRAASRNGEGSLQ
jgi:hypothetical protein